MEGVIRENPGAKAAYDARLTEAIRRADKKAADADASRLAAEEATRMARESARATTSADKAAADKNFPWYIP